jgi:DNA polymerase-1
MQAALAERGLRARMLLQVHDELLFEAPPEEAEAVAALAREIMGAALPLRVPLVVDVKTGKDWSEV